MGTCNNCIDLTFIALGENAELTGFGFSCLNGEELPEDTYGYLRYSFNHSGGGNSNSRSSSNDCSNDRGDLPPLSWDDNSRNKSKSKGKSKSRIVFKPKIDGFGRYIIEEDNISTIEHEDDSDSSGQAVGIVTSSANQDFGAILFTYIEGSTSFGSNKSSRTCIKIPCDYNQCEVEDCGQIECTEECSTESFSNSYYDVNPCSPATPPQPCSDSTTSEDRNENCNFSIPCNSFEAANSTCTTVSEICKEESNINQTDDEIPCTGKSSSSSSASGTRTTTVSDSYTVDRAKGFSKQKVDTILNLKANNSPTDPCGTICEINNGKDGCWIGASSTMISVVDTSEENLTYYSKVKVRIGLYKKDMDDEKITAIKGTVYFYENNLPECCCGTGNPIGSTSFSISNSADMKINSGFDEFCSTEIYSKNNDELQDYAGSTIQACYKIEDITYTD